MGGGCSEIEKNEVDAESKLMESEEQAVLICKEEDNEEKAEEEPTPISTPILEPTFPPVEMDIETEFEYFLQDGDENKLLGFHMPEGYKLRNEDTRYAVTVYNGNGIGISIAGVEQEFADMLRNGNYSETYSSETESYTEVEIIDTEYGMANLYKSVYTDEAGKEVAHGYLLLLMWDEKNYQVKFMAAEASLEEQEELKLAKTVFKQLFSHNNS